MILNLKYNLLAILFFCAFFVHGKTITYTVILRSNFGTHTLWDGNVINIYGFSPTLNAAPTLPAKVLYCDEGDTVILNARSVSQGDHHTIHLHGLDVDTRNDGDPATSFELQHMQDTTYTFVAKHAGTYIYHCHVADVVHVQMGMYGLIVVKAAGGTKNAWTGGPAYDNEYAWLTSEVDELWHDSIPKHDTADMTVQIPLYAPDYFLINGKSKTQLSALQINATENEKVYLRLANIGFYNNRYAFPSSLKAQIIDSDGRPLPQAEINDTALVMPGERYGIMFTPSAQGIDSIDVAFINMNTDSVWQHEYVKVNVNGYVGIHPQTSSSSINIYPNPANEYLIIDVGQMEDQATATIYNVYGAAVYKNRLTQKQKLLDLSLFAEGIYTVVISNGNNNTHQQVVVIH